MHRLLEIFGCAPVQIWSLTGRGRGLRSESDHDPHAMELVKGTGRASGLGPLNQSAEPGCDGDSSDFDNGVPTVEVGGDRLGW